MDFVWPTFNLTFSLICFFAVRCGLRYEGILPYARRRACENNPFRRCLHGGHRSNCKSHQVFPFNSGEVLFVAIASSGHVSSLIVLFLLLSTSFHTRTPSLPLLPTSFELFLAKDRLIPVLIFLLIPSPTSTALLTVTFLFSTPARVKLLKFFNWTKVGTIYQNSPRYSLVSAQSWYSLMYGKGTLYPLSTATLSVQIRAVSCVD